MTDTQAKSYKYGCPAMVPLPDFDLELIDAIHADAIRLWNFLVECEAKNREAYREIVARSGADEIAQLEDIQAQAQAALDALLKVRKADRDKAAFASAKEHMKAVKTDLKAARKAAAAGR